MVSYLPPGKACLQTVLKTIILFTTEYGCAAYDEGEKLWQKAGNSTLPQ
jgi:hypothetical protein